MRAREIMASNVLTCYPDTNLAAVARIMWEGDCGMVPVSDRAGKVIGVITDRDICIAAGTRDRAARDILVRDVMSKSLHWCAPTDDVRAALTTMRNHRVRRLPVLGQDGRVLGIVSLNDIVMRGVTARGANGLVDELLDAIKSISTPANAPLAASA